ncbi:YbbR domain-containing protein [Desulfohalotomaculum tongense]|uniref:CdaR family protein n=1 Tax=Desulforadius tongensis TaxID=1216062 RepID=UPI00195C5C6B|nr:CdaR family protein [Desulforadius tongensis]MBM7853893.1 YbbR domain-containing protein [Desulforadius tongensis]
MKIINFISTYWRRYSLMIISLFMAVLLWLYVTNLQHPLQEQEFRVSLQTEGLPEGMVIEELPERVSVRVKAGGVKVGGLEAKDFKARVDLSAVELGENNLPVEVTAPPGVEITRVNPNQVTIQVDKLVEKQVPVQVFLRGTPQPGYSTGEPVLVPTAVLARGPSRLLNTINQVPVTVDVEGANQNLDYTLPISLQQGGVNQVKLSPEVVRVVVPVNITVPYKVVPVRVNTAGTPAEGYEVEQTAAEPAVVKVYAPSHILNRITEIKTETVNINGIAANLKRAVDLDLPRGAVLLQPNIVNITVKLNKKPEPPAEPPAAETAEPVSD